jgi:hypothetical protein
MRKFTFAYFVVVRVNWMSFVFAAREWRIGALIMLKTLIVMSLLIFRLVPLLVLRLVSFMDLTIAYMVLVHERMALCLDALVTAHVLLMLIVPRVDMVFLLQGLTLTLSRETWTAHVFPVVVHVPLAQMVRCKRL